MSNLRLLDPVFGDTFENTLRHFFPPTLFEGEASQLKMRIDVTENDKAYLVRADIPGVKKDDINVSIDGNIVRIDAQARSQKQTRGEGEKVLCSERYYGSVSRAFSVGQDIDTAKVDAKYTDGVLTVQLPKKPSAETRKIAIQ